MKPNPANVWPALFLEIFYSEADFGWLVGEEFEVSGVVIQSGVGMVAVEV